MENSNLLSSLDQIVRWITPLLACIISLVIFVYRSKVKELGTKIEEEKKERKDTIKELIKTLKELEAEVKKADRDLIQSDKDIIQIVSSSVKEEREGRESLIEKQRQQVSDIYDKIEDITVSINRVIEKLESHIISQDKICNERHKWNGSDRRSL